MFRSLLRYLAILAAALWCLLGLWVFALYLFMRVMYADGLYWTRGGVIEAMPAWAYVPEYFVLNSWLLIVAALPLFVLWNMGILLRS
jgi:hypothetical protein